MGIFNLIKKILPRQKKWILSRLNRIGIKNAIRKDDVFLVSYPRSGSTWLSFMLACLIYPKEKGKITLKNLRDYIPDINYLYLGAKRGSIEKIIPSDLEKPRIIFVHALYNSLFPKVIYLVRDPRDVIVSFWHLKKNLNLLHNTSLKKFIRKKKTWSSNWDEHVESWLINRHENIKFINYEDLIKNPEEVLKNISVFAGIKATKKQIKEAISLTSFQRMRKLEKNMAYTG